MQKKIRAALVVAFAGASVLGVTQPASAAPQKPAPGIYQIQTRLTDHGTKLCLDADARHPGAGAAVRVLTCGAGTAQKWQYRTIAGRPVWINVGHPGFALAAVTLTPGAKLTLKRASGTDRTQNFTAEPAAAGTVVIRSTTTRLVLEPKSVKKGQQVHLRIPTGHTGPQSWVLRRLG